MIQQAIKHKSSSNQSNTNRRQSNTDHPGAHQTHIIAQAIKHRSSSLNQTQILQPSSGIHVYTAQVDRHIHSDCTWSRKLNPNTESSNLSAIRTVGKLYVHPARHTCTPDAPTDLGATGVPKASAATEYTTATPTAGQTADTLWDGQQDHPHQRPRGFVFCLRAHRHGWGRPRQSGAS